MPQIKLSELARLIHGKAEDIRGDPEKVLTGAAPFDKADGNAVTFADNSGLLKKVKESPAGAVIVPREGAGDAETNLVFSDNPRLAFARVMHYFYPRRRRFSGLSRMSSIGENFKCGQGAAVAPFVFIGDNVNLGDRAVIHPQVCIEDDVCIGDDTEIMSNVSVMQGCVIGSRVIIQAGTVIGSEGFGFTPDQGSHFKIPQVGIVQIDDDVEIGACNTIDRATFGKTLICSGVKTDNQVHIAHNVEIGEHSIIVAQVGIAGSTNVGKNVILAGQAGIGGHISIGDKAVIGPQAGVARDVEPGKTVSGTPAMPHGRWLRVQQIVTRLPGIKKQVTDLEKRMAGFEKSTAGKKDDQE